MESTESEVAIELLMRYLELRLRNESFGEHLVERMRLLVDSCIFVRLNGWILSL